MKNKKNRLIVIVAVVSIFTFIFGVASSFLVINYVIDKRTDIKEEKAGVNTSNLNVDKISVKDSGVATAVERVYNSVVMIENSANGRLLGSGSGFIYKTDENFGYIMTNHHVIEDATIIKVLFSSEETATAILLGSDEYLDIAILQVDKKYVKQQAPIAKNSNEIKLGDNIFTIGTPVGGEYFNTVTSGIVSGVNRKITVSINAKEDWIMEAIQVDAAINPGNSGGPLLNSSGEVIGVNSLKLVDSTIEGMGFAIKIEDALLHAEDLEKGKSIERPFLGINLTAVGNKVDLAMSGIKIDPSIESGVVVLSVIEGSGASKSTLKKGDVITKIDNQEIENSAYLKYILYKYSPGDTVKITYIRNGETKTTDVALTKSE